MRPREFIGLIAGAVTLLPAGAIAGNPISPTLDPCCNRLGGVA